MNESYEMHLCKMQNQNNYTGLPFQKRRNELEIPEIMIMIINNFICIFYSSVYMFILFISLYIYNSNILYMRN